MAKTPTRIPYYITRTATSMLIELYFNGATNPDYTIQRYAFGTSSDKLRENIAPYAGDYYRHDPPVGKLSGVTLSPGADQIPLLVKVDGTDQPILDCVDGWEESPEENVFTDLNFRGVVGIDSLGFFSASNDGDVTKVYWKTNKGKEYLQIIPTAASGTLLNVPILPSTLDISNDPTVVSVTGLTDTDTQVFHSTFDIVCPKTETKTLAFINKYGGWSTIDFLGAHIGVSNIERNSYNSFGTGGLLDYNINGKYTEQINTGWVDEGYVDLVQQMLLSETVQMIGETENTSVVIKDVRLDHKTSARDKVINYTIQIEISKPIIAIV